MKFIKINSLNVLNIIEYFYDILFLVYTLFTITIHAKHNLQFSKRNQQCPIVLFLENIIEYIG